MYEFDDSDYYFYPVSGTRLDKQGKKEPFDFDVKFARLESARLEEIFGTGSAPAAPVKRSDLEVAHEVFIGWDKVRNKGVAVEFTYELREQMLKCHYTLAAIVAAWMTSLKDGVGKTLPQPRRG